MTEAPLTPKSANRRRFLRRLACFGIGVGFCDAVFVEPQWLEINRHTVPLARSPGQPPIKLLHLSDLHAHRYFVSLNQIADALRQGLAWKPDLICVTGDFVTGQYEHMADYLGVLSVLAPAAPTFACLGNHDGGRWSISHGGFPDTRPVRELIIGAGMTLLDNAATTVQIGARRLNLVGVADWWADRLDPARAFAELPRSNGVSTVLLSHNPDTKSVLRSWPWGLLLCGHAHGGQFRLPIIGTPFAPVRDKRYVEGLHRWEDRWLHITKGVGNVVGLRFNCRPEISLLTLT